MNSIKCPYCEHSIAFEIDSKSYHSRVEALDLSVRPFNALWRNGVKTIERLAFLTENYLTNGKPSLLDIQGLGPKSIDEIVSRLKEKGYQF